MCVQAGLTDLRCGGSERIVKHRYAQRAAANATEHQVMRVFVGNVLGQWVDEILGDGGC